MSRAKLRGGHVESGTLAMRRYRASGRPEAEDYRDRERKRNKARWEATQALVRKHLAEFTVLYEAELQHAGVEPRRAGRPARVRELAP